jgi:hypothetical protein
MCKNVCFFLTIRQSHVFMCHYVHTYIHTYTYIYVCVCMYVYIYIYIYIHIMTYIHISAHEYMKLDDRQKTFLSVKNMILHENNILKHTKQQICILSKHTENLMRPKTFLFFLNVDMHKNKILRNTKQY